MTLFPLKIYEKLHVGSKSMFCWLFQMWNKAGQIMSSGGLKLANGWIKWAKSWASMKFKLMQNCFTHRNIR